MPENIYEELARHLDQAVAGVPMSPTLLKILQILFPEREAEVALKLTFYDNRTASEWQELIGEGDSGLEDILDGMARRGTVYSEQRPGQQRTYRLLPSIVGFTETPFWAGRDTPEARALAPLWVDYYEHEFAEELQRGTPLVRVVPIAESLEDESEVLPFDALREKLEGVSYAAVAKCPCRQIQRYVGKGCDHSLENCLHFGGMARYIVEQGMGREISGAEALEILKAATEEGLVHVCDNIQGALSTICNCCPCCCVFLKSRSRGYATLSSSNYVARVEEADCAGCGTCEDRCPVGAVVVREDEIAHADADLCIGCGVCTLSCDSQAMGLVVREQVTPPPEIPEFLAARLKR